MNYLGLSLHCFVSKGFCANGGTFELTPKLSLADTRDRICSSNSVSQLSEAAFGTGVALINVDCFEQHRIQDALIRNVAWATSAINRAAICFRRLRKPILLGGPDCDLRKIVLHDAVEQEIGTVAIFSFVDSPANVPPVAQNFFFNDTLVWQLQDRTLVTIRKHSKLIMAHDLPGISAVACTWLGSSKPAKIPEWQQKGW